MRYLIILIIAVWAGAGFADSYLLNGGQSSTISYQMIQKIFPDPDTKSVTVTFVVPQNFSSPTYSQVISDFRIRPTREPLHMEKRNDERNNSVLKYEWGPPFAPFDIEISFRAINTVELKPLNTRAAFPLLQVAGDVRPFLSSTKQVPSDDPVFIRLAGELTRGSKTEFDAVQKILTWVIDHMTYVLVPEDHGAQYAMQSGKGNCQNYSHLAAGLMRAAGIPVRIVNGVTLKEPYEILVAGQVLQLNMAQGRHSWIEVYFPDLGWVPFDPQQSQLFVSNRFIRIESGLDNDDTMDDGLIQWKRSRGSKAKVSFEELIEGSFISDTFEIAADVKKYGPKKLLLTPSVDAAFTPVAMVPEKKPEPETVPDEKGPFNKPFITGNLEYPEGVNFIFTRETHEGSEGSMELRKNFLVETAEYVTGNYQYAQTFILDKTINLQKIGLVLHKFGGSGQLVLELRENVNGTPSAEVAARSRPVDLSILSSRPGYEWVDFSFEHEKLMLTPDRYWISLSFTGGPIVNWFYSYGKPVGPMDGTRYKGWKENRFDKVLGYEFNYRVLGQSR